MGREKTFTQSTRTEQVRLSALGDGEGRMWSLFPQTSSGNPNNSLYLPPAAPSTRLHELRTGVKRFFGGPGNTEG